MAYTLNSLQVLSKSVEWCRIANLKAWGYICLDTLIFYPVLPYIPPFFKSDKLISINFVEIYVKCIYSLIFTTVSNDERESSRMQPKDDDNQSDYFADVETSSCGSLELIGDWSDLEEENGK